jgi:hypothetical protein
MIKITNVPAVTTTEAVSSRTYANPLFCSASFFRAELMSGVSDRACDEEFNFSSFLS